MKKNYQESVAAAYPIVQQQIRTTGSSIGIFSTSSAEILHKTNPRLDAKMQQAAKLFDARDIADDTDADNTTSLAFYLGSILALRTIQVIPEERLEKRVEELLPDHRGSVKILDNPATTTALRLSAQELSMRVMNNGHNAYRLYAQLAGFDSLVDGIAEFYEDEPLKLFARSGFGYMLHIGNTAWEDVSLPNALTELTNNSSALYLPPEWLKATE